LAYKLLEAILLQTQTGNVDKRRCYGPSGKKLDCVPLEWQTREESRAEMALQQARASHASRTKDRGKWASKDTKVLVTHLTIIGKTATPLVEDNTTMHKKQRFQECYLEA